MFPSNSFPYYISIVTSLIWLWLMLYLQNLPYMSVLWNKRSPLYNLLFFCYMFHPCKIYVVIYRISDTLIDQNFPIKHLSNWPSQLGRMNPRTRKIRVQKGSNRSPILRVNGCNKRYISEIRFVSIFIRSAWILVQLSINNMLRAWSQAYLYYLSLLWAMEWAFHLKNFRVYIFSKEPLPSFNCDHSLISVHHCLCI